MRVTLCLDARRPWPDLLALAAHAERAGWDAVRVGDRVGDATSGADCWAVVGALSVAVPRVRLDAVVRDEVGRHPAVVAKLASTADQLSGGRLLLGMAPGTDADGEARLAEGCEVVRSLARDDRTTFRGRFYFLQDAPLDPKPVQLPFPVMLVGGSAQLAARVADHWSLSGPQKAVGAQLASVAAASQAAGRDRDAITVSVWADGAESLGEYAVGGVDELVLPDAVLGPDRAEWPESLARLRRATEGMGPVAP